MQPFQSTRRFDQSVQHPPMRNPIPSYWLESSILTCCQSLCLGRICASFCHAYAHPGRMAQELSSRDRAIAENQSFEMSAGFGPLGLASAKHAVHHNFFAVRFCSHSQWFLPLVPTNLSPQPPPTHPPENAASPWESVYSWLKVQRIDTIGRVIDVRMEHEQCTLNASHC